MNSTEESWRKAAKICDVSGEGLVLSPVYVSGGEPVFHGGEVRGR